MLSQYCISPLSNYILSYAYNVVSLTFEEPGCIRIDNSDVKNIINIQTHTQTNKDTSHQAFKCHNTPLMESIIYPCDITTNIYIKYDTCIKISFKSLATTIKNISSDGYIGLINEGYNFYKQCSLETIPKNIILDNLTTFKHMFDMAINFNSDISHWDVSHIQTMEYMFSDAITFNQNLSGWNTKNLQNTKCMFRNAKRFNMLNIKNWILPKQNSKKFEMFLGI
jgi:hypothetical protein